MQLIKKIDHKIFWPSSIIVTLTFCLFARGVTEILVILGVYISTLLSLFLLMAILQNLISSSSDAHSRNKSKRRMFMYMLLHVLFLFGSIGLGVHFVGNRIILAILNYVGQIFVLGFGLRKNLKN